MKKTVSDFCFYQVPDFIAASGLPQTAKLLYGYLLFASQQGRKTTWAGEKTMGEKIGVNERQARTMLGVLVDCGLVIPIRRGKRLTNYHHVIPPDTCDRQKIAAHPEQSDRQRTTGSDRQETAGGDRQDNAAPIGIEKDEKKKSEKEGKEREGKRHSTLTSQEPQTKEKKHPEQNTRGKETTEAEETTGTNKIDNAGKSGESGNSGGAFTKSKSAGIFGAEDIRRFYVETFGEIAGSAFDCDFQYLQSKYATVDMSRHVEYLKSVSTPKLKVYGVYLQYAIEWKRQHGSYPNRPEGQKLLAVTLSPTVITHAAEIIHQYIEDDDESNPQWAWFAAYSNKWIHGHADEVRQDAANERQRNEFMAVIERARGLIKVFDQDDPKRKRVVAMLKDFRDGAVTLEGLRSGVEAMERVGTMNSRNK